MIERYRADLVGGGSITFSLDAGSRLTLGLAAQMAAHARGIDAEAIGILRIAPANAAAKAVVPIPLT